MDVRASVYDSSNCYMGPWYATARTFAGRYYAESSESREDAIAKLIERLKAAGVRGTLRVFDGMELDYGNDWWPKR